MVTSAALLVPPPPPALRVHRVTSDSITLRWAPGSTGHAPVTGYGLQYKVTYGEWTERLVSSCAMVTMLLLSGGQVSFYAEEHTLRGLQCGRRYHMLMYQANTVGESGASPVINTLTVGAKPAPPPAAAFIMANSSLAVLRLDTWQQPACPILYFVIEYKLSSAPAWTMGRLGCWVLQ